MRYLLMILVLQSMAFGLDGKQPKSKTDLKQPIPLDRHVVMGTLPNGLRYYVRVNRTPENRAELRLAVNAGSVLEDDDQQGFAHFVEHMAFNGSKNFKKNELVDFLESVGMRFGNDVNAATGQDATFYMLQIPTEDPAILEKGFQVLADWACELTFSAEEIDKERGVILEEWRQGKGADERMMKEQFPVLLHGSRYADRLPIGKREIIEKGSHESLRRFYREWYRPDLMAVVAVGDFDSDEMVKMIHDKFGGMTNPNNSRTRGVVEVPIHDNTLFAIASDKEATQTIVSMLFKAPPHKVRNYGDGRQSFVEDLFLGMLNQRLHERTQEAKPPFLFGMASRARFVREMGGFMLVVAVPETGILDGFSELLEETVRVQRFGFTETELERQKKELLRSAEKAFEERETTRSAWYASQYMAHFLMDTPAPDAEIRRDMTQALVPGITLQEVNALVRAWVTDKGRVVTVNMPEKEGLSIPTEAEMVKVMHAMDGATVTPYEDEVIATTLIQKLPNPGKIVKETEIKELGITQWTLDNGVRVVLKPTEFKNDEIRMKAFSPGGYSLAGEETVFSAKYADNIVNACGLGEFANVELKKMLAGKMIGLWPYVEELYQGLDGWASPKDLETLFQLTYLHFTGLRKDQNAFQALKNKLHAKVANRAASPEIAFKDKLKSVIYQDHSHRQPLTVEDVEKLDLDLAVDFFADRFADPGVFTFVFVGNLDLEKMRPYVTQYLSTLPKTNSAENWMDLGVRPPRGVVREKVFKGTEPKSQVALVFSGDFSWSLETRHRIASLMDVLRIAWRERLREDLGGVYSIAAWDSVDRYPYSHYLMGIYFGCDPQRVDEMVDEVFRVINRVKTEGIELEYLAKVKEIQQRKRETDLKENLFWLNALVTYLQLGEDARRIQEYPKMVESLTSEIIQETARELLREDGFVQVVLYPEQNPG